MLVMLAEMDARAHTHPDEIRLVRAPGRINLIGEHTDYNDGFALPAAISLDTWIASLPRADGRVHVASLQMPDEHVFDVTDPGPPDGSWRDLVAGVAITVAERGVALRGVTAVVDSTIPIGAGLSSSAALELAAAWTLAAQPEPPLDPLELAKAAQQAENEYAGVRCGLMDQFAATFGRAGHALLLDCMTLDFHALPLPRGIRLVAIDTRSPRQLGASQYNARRAQCERGAALLAKRHPDVRSLRDVTTGMLRDATSLLDDATLRRCRHVVEENERVLATGNALVNNDLAMVGLLFAQSHASLRDLFEVSSPELDALVDIATGTPGVIGARLTGAGFGGCTVNLVRDKAVEALREAALRGFRDRFGRKPGFHVLDAVSGAGTVG